MGANDSLVLPLAPAELTGTATVNICTPPGTLGHLGVVWQRTFAVVSVSVRLFSF